MLPRYRKHAMTKVEVATLIVLLAVGMSLVASCLGTARDRARRTECSNNLKQIGLALQNYNSTHSCFPGSAEIIKDDGQKKVGGWSFLVKVLPYMEYNTIYKSLNLKTDPEGSDPAGQAALQTSIKEFLCPASPNKPPDLALTNFKAMGATCERSLAMVTGHGEPPYGTARMHPDGALFPTNDGVPLSALCDGVSHTVICVETIDDVASRWTVGREATLVGLPNASIVGAAIYRDYFAPKGFDGKFGPDSAVSRAGLRTFLSYDFKTGDPGPYEDPGFNDPTPVYGPSSGHPDVVNHLMGDGSVQWVRKDVDAATYMFVITKAGGPVL